MFYFPGCTLCVIRTVSYEYEGFPHSEIFGSPVARHLPETYRSHATSFIPFLRQGIHHTPLNFPLGNLKTSLPRRLRAGPRNRRFCRCVDFYVGAVTSG